MGFIVPAEMCELAVKKIFYAKLDPVIKQYLSCETLIVLGDFETAFGTQRDGYELCVGTHDSGTRKINS